MGRAQRAGQACPRAWRPGCAGSFSARALSRPVSASNTANGPSAARPDPGCGRAGRIRRMSREVVAVQVSPAHTFSKQTVDAIMLREGLGVEGDAHCGATVKHRSRVAADPSQPNLRQVHLIHGELFETLKEGGHLVAPGDLGENITTQGIDLLALPVGSRLRIGETVVTVTGLRNPCQQINGFQSGLLK